MSVKAIEPAVHPPAPRILVLKIDREIIDAAGIAEHQRDEIAALHLGDLRRSHAGLDARQRQRPALAAKPGRAEHQERRNRLAHLRGNVPADHRAEGEAAHGDAFAWRDAGDALGDDRGQAFSAVRFGCIGGFAEAGQVAGQYAVARGEVSIFRNQCVQEP